MKPIIYLIMIISLQAVGAPADFDVQKSLTKDIQFTPIANAKGQLWEITYGASAADPKKTRVTTGTQPKVNGQSVTYINPRTGREVPVVAAYVKVEQLN